MSTRFFQNLFVVVHWITSVDGWQQLSKKTSFRNRNFHEIKRDAIKLWCWTNWPPFHLVKRNIPMTFMAHITGLIGSPIVWLVQLTFAAHWKMKKNHANIRWLLNIDSIWFCFGFINETNEMKPELKRPRHATSRDAKSQHFEGWPFQKRKTRTERGRSISRRDFLFWIKHFYHIKWRVYETCNRFGSEKWLIMLLLYQCPSGFDINHYLIFRYVDFYSKNIWYSLNGLFAVISLT